jgi:hypothetical protein
VIVKGGAGQSFCSRFNCHALGWVRLTGLPRAPALEDMKGYLIHTAYEPAGEFECSNGVYVGGRAYSRCLPGRRN